MDFQLEFFACNIATQLSGVGENCLFTDMTACLSLQRKRICVIIFSQYKLNGKLILVVGQKSWVDNTAGVGSTGVV